MKNIISNIKTSTFLAPFNVGLSSHALRMTIILMQKDRDIIKVKADIMSAVEELITLTEPIDK